MSVYERTVYMTDKEAQKQQGFICTPDRQLTARLAASDESLIISPTMYFLIPVQEREISLEL